MGDHLQGGPSGPRAAASLSPVDPLGASPAEAVTDRSGPVAGLLLAAGRSTRFGANKLLLQLDGEPLVRRAARTALAAGLDPLVVVVGHQAPLVEVALEGLPCLLIRNPDPSRGQGTSLRLGLDALPACSGASVVLLADMPRVTAALLAALVAGYRRSGAPLVLADYGGTLAPPVLYERALFAELTDPGDAPGKQVVARHRGRALTVPFPPEALLDLDLPSDLARHLQTEGSPP